MKTVAAALLAVRIVVAAVRKISAIFSRLILFRATANRDSVTIAAIIVTAEALAVTAV